MDLVSEETITEIRMQMKSTLTFGHLHLKKCRENDNDSSQFLPPHENVQLTRFRMRSNVKGFDEVSFPEVIKKKVAQLK